MLYEYCCGRYTVGWPLSEAGLGLRWLVCSEYNGRRLPTYIAFPFVLSTLLRGHTTCGFFRSPQVEPQMVQVQVQVQVMRPQAFMRQHPATRLTGSGFSVKYKLRYNKKTSLDTP